VGITGVLEKYQGEKDCDKTDRQTDRQTDRERIIIRLIIIITRLGSEICHVLSLFGTRS
jgi:hypothetical protein